jgi:hypothetical protein
VIRRPNEWSALVVALISVSACLLQKYSPVDPALTSDGEKNGFEIGWQVEKIVGASDYNGLMFRVKWSVTFSSVVGGLYWTRVARPALRWDLLLENYYY